ncbi:hypothetical protein D3C73_1557450 [compost metagenome]
MLDVVTELGHAGEPGVQLGNDRRDIPLPIDQATNQRGAFIEFDHAFGVQQYVAFLGRLVLEAIAGTPAWGLAAVETHKAIPLCQTRCPVTL